MKYDFDQVIDRSTNRSSKYDERMKKFGTMDVIPLWVADMDFKTAQPIIDALKKRRKCQAMSDEGAIDEYLDSLTFEMLLAGAAEWMDD